MAIPKIESYTVTLEDENVTTVAADGFQLVGDYFMFFLGIGPMREMVVAYYKPRKVVTIFAE